ncbi:hypothetical protein [Novosphingobium guangzhouense]|uniref:Secreted protein n=1 Tax=Novosphingobium guangzhouense TaxID=1850347 RepID=A0A2K2FT80_9SPHN|nr:hypothetical protein [Novosphingobium guangzhouense]PNU01978.1 hypothetical protein A8V01_11030 [Novosphingobium guangzhouense]
MKMLRSRTAVSLAAIAAFAVTATPVMAHGPRGDWRGHRHYRGGGIDGGDLLAGLLVVGGVAAIASAVSKDRADSRDAEPAPYRYPGGPQADDHGDDDAGYDPQPSDDDRGMAPYPGGPVSGQDRVDNAGMGGSIGMAVDACEAELERAGNRVDAINGARRMGERYSVEGRLQDGRPFACSVDGEGHIRSVAVDGRGMT